jgi:hypothetical protein
MSQPIITPRRFLHALYGRDALPPEVAGCPCAVVAFGQFRDMQRKLAAAPVSSSLFSLLHPTHQFIGHVAGRKILALDGLQGGPLAATVVEERAHNGIKQLLGYGYAGSLTRTVPIGQLALAEDALISNGISRAYLPQAARVVPNGTLVRQLRACAADAGALVGSRSQATAIHAPPGFTSQPRGNTHDRRHGQSRTAHVRGLQHRGPQQR